jgi:hypothetical protein
MYHYKRWHERGDGQSSGSGSLSRPTPLPLLPIVPKLEKLGLHAFVSQGACHLHIQDGSVRQVTKHEIIRVLQSWCLFLGSSLFLGDGLFGSRLLGSMILDWSLLWGQCRAELEASGNVFAGFGRIFQDYDCNRTS